MGLFINTNVVAVNAQRNLGITSRKMGRALERLSSGLRINRAADDAAGLSISEGLRSQIGAMKQASRNAQDAVSMIQTAEGALNEVHGILQRMRELTVQAGNETLSDNDRTAVGEELLTLKNEIDNIASRTKFNGLELLTGSLSTAQDASSTAKIGVQLTTTAVASISGVDVKNLKAGTTYTLADVGGTNVSITDGTTTVNSAALDATIGADGVMSVTFTGAIQATITIVGVTAKTGAQIAGDLDTLTIVTSSGSGSAQFRVGAATSDNVQVDFADMQSAVIGTGSSEIGVLITDNTAVSTVAKANTLLVSVDQAVTDVSQQRAKLGASQNQIETAIASLGVGIENLTASESRIRDADIAEVSTELVTRQIMQQAGIAVLAQANTSSQSVLRLLQ